MLFQRFVPSSVRGNATVWLSPWKDKMFPKKTLQMSSGNPRGFTAGWLQQCQCWGGQDKTIAGTNFPISCLR